MYLQPNGYARTSDIIMWRRLVLLFAFLATPLPAVAEGGDCAYDPARTHLSRVIAVDSTGGPIYGALITNRDDRQQARALMLKDHEVVLTFDDGPSAIDTPHILDILDRHCVKATFFSVGRMALASPKTIQEVLRRGHTVGTHTWSHPREMDKMPVDEIKIEVEKGFAAVSHAVGQPIAPFFRFPGLRDSPGGVGYLASRNISAWSVDVVSGDTDPGASPGRLQRDTLLRIHQLGKGIILFHDIKKVTAEALDGILTGLEQDGFKFVQVVSNTNYQPNPELMAKADPFRTPPEAATMTGRWVGDPQEQFPDGSVDVMRTEWLDLKRASEEYAGAGAGSSSASPTPEAKVSSAWPASGDVR
jgi:peptidoglycan/xylan/chitin deacetylase (PgdA/CDA1 family)